MRSSETLDHARFNFMNHPSARIPITNMRAYISSTPKAPLDSGTAEFIKGKPAITQQAKDWRYYESTITHMHELEGAVLKEYKEGGAWKEHYKTWRAACEPLGKSRSQIDRLIKEEREIKQGSECATFDKEHTLEKVNSLPNPMADIDADLAASVHAGPAPRPTPVAAKAPEPPRDAIGFPIPKDLLKIWDRRQEVQDLMTLVSKARSAVQGFCTGKDHKADPLYSHKMAWQHPLENLNAIYFNLAECKPDVVCPICSGTLVDNRLKNKADCEECRRIGFVSEHKWTALRKSTDHYTAPLIDKHLKECREV